jgi:predicted NBD/HSP70 family sugar kinase
VSTPPDIFGANNKKSYNKIMKLLFDIGGTHMRLAIGHGDKLGVSLTVDAPKNFRDALSKFKQAALQLTGGEKISVTVGGVPRFAQDKLTFWQTHPVIKEFAKFTKSKIILENDSALAGLGEAIYGAGKGKNIISYLTFGTGFGGARIVGGKIDANYFGFEPKMQIADYDPLTHKAPPLNLFVSGRGIFNRYHTQPKDIIGKKTWAEIESWITIAVNNAAVFWSPEIIVIGGGVGLDPHLSVLGIQKYIDKRLMSMPNKPRIAKAKLGQASGLMGALVMANE